MAAVVAATTSVLADENTRLANTTVARIVEARGELDDPAVLKECCARLQKINGMLKARVAEADAEACHEAMKGGLTGIGCDDTRLVATLCTRTKIRASARPRRASSPPQDQLPAAHDGAGDAPGRFTSTPNTSVALGTMKTPTKRGGWSHQRARRGRAWTRGPWRGPGRSPRRRAAPGS